MHFAKRFLIEVWLYWSDSICIRVISMTTIYSGIRSSLLCIAVLLPGVAASLASAAEPVLELSFSKQHQQLARSDLLKHPALRTITVPADSAYQRTMEYRALPLLAILRDLRGVDTVQFKAEDGFVANIPAQLLSGPAEPWLAIEAAHAPWPALKAGGRSAGPFYLVWLAPEKSAISPEQWPYQIAAISEVAALQTRYPQILPDPSATSDSAQYRGMQAYITNCAVCHQVNGGGDAQVGPDLNRPFNPTEYFQPEFLRKFIRNPAAVRTWPQLRMPGFPEQVLSDAQLDDVLAYLRHMAQRK